MFMHVVTKVSRLTVQNGTLTTNDNKTANMFWMSFFASVFEVEGDEELPYLPRHQYNEELNIIDIREWHLARLYEVQWELLSQPGRPRPRPRSRSRSRHTVLKFYMQVFRKLISEGVDGGVWNSLISKNLAHYSFL